MTKPLTPGEAARAEHRRQTGRAGLPAYDWDAIATAAIEASPEVKRRRLIESKAALIEQRVRIGELSFYGAYHQLQDLLEDEP